MTIKTPGYINSLLLQKCPHCRQGNMFQQQFSWNVSRYLKMHDRCPVCDQEMELEPGFYYGTAYVSYALTVAFSVFTFVIWWLMIGFSLEDNRFFWWIGINAFCMLLSQPYLMRLSRTIWLSFFVRFDADWAAENE